MHKLTSRRRALLQKLVATQLLKKVLTIYGTQDSLACSQGPISGHYPEPDESTLPTLPFLIHFNIIFPSTPRSYKRFLSFRFSNQNFVFISDISHACYMPTYLILLNLILVYIMISIYYICHYINILLVL
jgi:hypothetical protein